MYFSRPVAGSMSHEVIRRRSAQALFTEPMANTMKTVKQVRYMLLMAE